MALREVNLKIKTMKSYKNSNKGVVQKSKKENAPDTISKSQK